MGRNCVACMSSVDLPVGDYLKANETFSTFLLTNGNLSSATVDQLLKARLNLQVISQPLQYVMYHVNSHCTFEDSIKGSRSSKPTLYFKL